MEEISNSQHYVNINAEETDHLISNENSKMKLLAPVPWSSDSLSVQLRKCCDYSVRISADVAKLGEQTRPVRVFTSGVFDLYHFGHAQAFRQAKTYFPGPVHLIVGLIGDEDYQNRKRLPIMNLEERTNCVRHCIWVDEVLAPCPRIISREFVRENKIDFVCYNDLLHKCDEETFAWLQKSKMFFSIQRTNAISTTEIIQRLERKIQLNKISQQ